VFAIGPGDLLDHDGLAAAALDAPHGIQQKDQQAPDRNELETPLGELIVSGGGLMAARTNCLGARAWAQGDFNAPAIGTEASPLINESGKTLTLI
jgi:hypothetical protein